MVSVCIWYLSCLYEIQFTIGYDETMKWSVYIYDLWCLVMSDDGHWLNRRFCNGCWLVTQDDTNGLRERAIEKSFFWRKNVCKYTICMCTQEPFLEKNEQCQHFIYRHSILSNVLNKYVSSNSSEAYECV